MDADKRWRGSQYKSLGPGCPEGVLGPYYVAYGFVYLGSVGCNYVVILLR